MTRTDQVVSPGGGSEPLPATESTRIANAATAAQLPFEDRQAFEDAGRGLIGSLNPPTVRNAEGKAVWDLEAYAFLDNVAPDTVNPSLWRMAQLLQNHGLFTVVDRIHQVRGDRGGRDGTGP